MRLAPIAALAASISLAGCVTAPPATVMGLAFTMPPEPYASAGLAALPRIAMTVMGAADLRLVCGDEYACAVMSPDGCTIVLAEAVWQNADIIAHEAAHCVGWPADHAGGYAIVTLIGGAR